MCVPTMSVRAWKAGQCTDPKPAFFAMSAHHCRNLQIPINVFELGLKNGLLREPEYVITYADFLLGAHPLY